LYTLLKKWFDVVIPSGPKNLLFTRVIENKSRFFSPAENVGLQNGILSSFSAAAFIVPNSLSTSAASATEDSRRAPGAKASALLATERRG